MSTRASPPPVRHYENFPVASWLCPPRLRSPIAAIYHFARTADDLADEGQVPADRRLAELAAYRDELLAISRGQAPGAGPWAGVFGPLAVQMQAFALPLQPLLDLLSAFEQDVRMSVAGQAHPDMASLLDYCSRSANPVGRLLLHLYDMQDARSLQESDAICSALQLINFWQDLSVDLPRRRCYLPLDACVAHGLPADAQTIGAAAWAHDATVQARAAPLLAELSAQARALMLSGAPLATRLPGRAGWELRAVVQGGLRVLDKVQALGPAVLHQRPRLHASDGPRIAWRMLRM